MVAEERGTLSPLTNVDEPAKDDEIACAFNTIRPSSGYTYPYEPLVADWATAVVLITEVPPDIEPLTILKTLSEAFTDESAVAPLSSISFKKVVSESPLPLKCNSQLPGSNFSLYRALLTLITKISSAL